MKSLYFKIFTFCLIVFCFPLQTLALFGIGDLGFGERHFGGYVLLTLPCTCTPGKFLITYKPLHIEGAPFPIVGTLVMSGTVQRWAYQQFVYPPVMSTWHLGEMSIGGECLVGVEPECVPIPTYGTVKKTGASYPGWPTPIF